MVGVEHSSTNNHLKSVTTQDHQLPHNIGVETSSQMNQVEQIPAGLNDELNDLEIPQNVSTKLVSEEFLSPAETLEEDRDVLL